MTNKTKIQFRRGTAAELAAANPILGQGEPSFATDTNVLKIGDGSTAYSSLSAISGGGGGGGLDNVVEDSTPQLGGNLDVNSRNIIGTGNVALTGSGTFTSIIKTGGTSSQFLKADGSVDSSTYLTDIVNDTTPSLGGELNLDNKDIVIDAKNNDGTQIDAGTPVYVVGYHAGSSKPLIAPADASDSTKMPAVGITNSDIAGSAEGTVSVMGVVSGIDTTSPVSFTIGDVVYVANGGGLTNVKPTTAAHLIQNLGRVTKVNASNGRILLLGAGRVNDIPNSGTFSGNIEAASFIKNGGTSSQFLKADGSVDSSTYLTSALANVVEDTTPQLGGALDAQSNNINSVGSLGVGGGATFEKSLIVNNAGVGTSADFQVKGDNDTHLIFTDAANDKVGISTQFPSHTFSVSGDINATTIVKQGGTSSQFLKADGSVDSSTYLTSALANVVEDTTPQLGGALDINSNNIIGTGNVALTGSGTFMSVIKSGGTSSQFLKADGSVDSSSYIESDPTGITHASGVTNIVFMGSGAYDALSSYDSSTIYFLVD